ncbi:MAG: TerD family protein [Nakamurella sp.]
MTVLSRGANTSLTGNSLDIAVAGALQGSVDLLVFQVGADRKVRSDDDLVFFNQPASPEGAVRLVAADRVSVDLAAVPASVETLVIAVALENAAAGSLAAIPGLGVTVSAAERHSAEAAGLTTERAAVLVEIYRRSGGWKLRNVSAGWAAGLSALVGEHGVSVDDGPAAAASEPPPPPMPATIDAPTPTPTPTARPQSTAAPQSPAAPAALHPATQDRQSGTATYPTPGGWPPPGGSLPQLPPIVPPQPGGWPAPGGPQP